MSNYFCSYTVNNNFFSNGIFPFPEISSTAGLRAAEQEILKTIKEINPVDIHILCIRKMSNEKAEMARPYFISYMADNDGAVQLGNIVMKAKGINTKEDVSFIESRICKGSLKKVRLLDFVLLEKEGA